jgi:hypothetical protein
MAVKLCPGKAGPCGNPIPPPVGMGRPREYCADCSPQRIRPGPSLRRLRVAPDVATSEPSPPPAERPRPAPPEPGATPAAEVLLYPSTLATLRAAGALEHWGASAALLMAQRIDGCDIVGSPLAAMIKAHRDSMSAALADSAADGDALDDVFSRTS